MEGQTMEELLLSYQNDGSEFGALTSCLFAHPFY